MLLQQQQPQEEFSLHSSRGLLVNHRSERRGPEERLLLLLQQQRRRRQQLICLMFLSHFICGHPSSISTLFSPLCTAHNCKQQSHVRSYTRGRRKHNKGDSDKTNISGSVGSILPLTKTTTTTSGFHFTSRLPLSRFSAYLGASTKPICHSELTRGEGTREREEGAKRAQLKPPKN